MDILIRIRRVVRLVRKGYTLRVALILSRPATGLEG